MADILFPKQQQFSHYSNKGVPRIIPSLNVPQPSIISISSDEDEEDRIKKPMGPVTLAEKRAVSSQKRKLDVDPDFLDSVKIAKQWQCDTRRKSAASTGSWTSSGEESSIKDHGRSTDSVSSSGTESSGRTGRVLVRKQLNGLKKKGNRVENLDNKSSDYKEGMILVKMKEYRKFRTSRTAVMVERPLKDLGEKKSYLVNHLCISKPAPAVSRRLPPSSKRVETHGDSRCKPGNSKVRLLGLILSIYLRSRNSWLVSLADTYNLF